MQNASNDAGVFLIFKKELLMASGPASPHDGGHDCHVWGLSMKSVSQEPVSWFDFGVAVVVLVLMIVLIYACWLYA
ncbi:hypothetical protein DVG40_23765 [Salmonella enterica subsp. enterica serovar Inganda]|nr:hypothetical protein [Salmonella enterica subsp. enterica serovar Inganda]